MQTRTWNYVGWTGRLASEVHPETGTTSYTYHADGNLSRKTLASGKFVMYSYDGYGRLFNGDGFDFNLQRGDVLTMKVEERGWAAVEN